MSFFKDLKFGHGYEKKALEYFEYTSVEIPQGKCKGYDFILDGTIKVEVKADRLAQRTGNIAIEYKSRGKPSGLSTTEAYYYIYFVERYSNNECYILPVEILKQLTTNSITVMGGDNRSSALYLLSLKKIQEYIAIPIVKS